MLCKPLDFSKLAVDFLLGVHKISCSEISADEGYLQLECDQLIYLLNLVCGRCSSIQTRNYNRVWVERRFPMEFFAFSHLFTSGKAVSANRGGGRRETRLSRRLSRVWKGHFITTMHASSSSKVPSKYCLAWYEFS